MNLDDIAPGRMDTGLLSGRRYNHVDSAESKTSMNSSYTDIFEASDIVIRDEYEGSAQEFPYGPNVVTTNLQKCKQKMIYPYYKMLSLIAWRPFASNAVRFQCFWSFVNKIYPLIVIGILMVWYVARIVTCHGRWSLDQVKPSARPSVQPFTSPTPMSNWTNWSSLVPSNEMNKSHLKALELGVAERKNCHHLFGSYIVPDLLYFIAYIIGLYHFRFQDCEGLYALMEKVYLQSSNQEQITRMLRLYLYIGFGWLLLVTGLSVYFHNVFGLMNTTGIHDSHPAAQYGIASLLVVAECASNCVIVSVVISHGSQCQLLKYYLNGIISRLEEKNTELRYIMKDILDVRRNLSRINGVLAFNTACVVFNISLITLIGFARFVTINLHHLDLWIYRMCFFLLWSAILCISVIPARLFTIPVKPSYLWGLLVVSTQVMILLVQLANFVPDNDLF